MQHAAAPCQTEMPFVCCPHSDLCRAGIFLHCNKSRSGIMAMHLPGGAVVLEQGAAAAILPSDRPAHCRFAGLLVLYGEAKPAAIPATRACGRAALLLTAYLGVLACSRAVFRRTRRALSLPGVGHFMPDGLRRARQKWVVVRFHRGTPGRSTWCPRP